MQEQDRLVQLIKNHVGTIQGVAAILRCAGDLYRFHICAASVTGAGTGMGNVPTFTKR